MGWIFKRLHVNDQPIALADRGILPEGERRIERERERERERENERWEREKEKERVYTWK